MNATSAACRTFTDQLAQASNTVVPHTSNANLFQVQIDDNNRRVLKRDAALRAIYTALGHRLDCLSRYVQTSKLRVFQSSPACVCVTVYVTVNILHSLTQLRAFRFTANVICQVTQA